MDRSWLSGTVSVEPCSDPIGKELGLRVTGEWPDASPDLWIRGYVYLVQEDSAPQLVSGTRGSQLSNTFRLGVSDYSRGPLRRLAHPDRPYQAAFDYEIWSGQPGRGRLLAKNSVLSEPISAGPLPLSGATANAPSRGAAPP